MRCVLLEKGGCAAPHVSLFAAESAACTPRQQTVQASSARVAVTPHHSSSSSGSGTAHLHHGCEVDAALVLLLECDVGRLFIQADAKALQLVLDELMNDDKE